MSTQISGDTGVSQCQPNSVSQDDLQASVVGKGPAFSAKPAVDQPVANATSVKVVLATELLDTNACFDPALSRFTPNVAGYYMATANMGIDGVSINAAVLRIQKNAIVVASQVLQVNFLGNSVLTAATMVFMNGTTDYLELFGQVNASSGNKLYAADTQFSACLLRAA